MIGIMEPPGSESVVSGIGSLSQLVSAMVEPYNFASEMSSGEFFKILLLNGLGFEEKHPTQVPAERGSPLYD